MFFQQVCCIPKCIVEVNYEEEDTLVDLKHQICKAFGLKPSRLKFVELALPESSRENDCKLVDLNLNTDCVMKIESRLEIPQQGPPIKLKVECKDKTFQIPIEEEDTIMDLKSVINGITNMKPSRQSFLNPGLPANVHDDDQVLGLLDLNTDFTLKVADQFSRYMTNSGKKVKIEWHQKYFKMYFKISFNRDDTISDLKRSIYIATGIEQTDQNFLNHPGIDAAADDNSYLLHQLNLESDFILRVSKRLCKASTNTAECTEMVDEIPANSIQKLLIKIEPAYLSANQHREIQGEGYTKLYKSRSGKNLVVLDMDRTLFDGRAHTAHLAPRPYLQMFLEGIYKYYDIGVWSATSRSFLEQKLYNLGMLTSSKFKILFYMDIQAMASVYVRNKHYLVKPLTKVWEIYPEFNYCNTLMCDDRKINFYYNPQNGIPIYPYFFENHYWDIELLNLLSYLKLIEPYNDFTILDHRLWKIYSDWVTDN